MTVFMGNLPFITTKEELEDQFKVYKLTKVAVVKDRGFAFIDAEDEDRMIADHQKLDIGGRRIIVAKARNKPQRRRRKKVLGNKARKRRSQ